MRLTGCEVDRSGEMEQIRLFDNRARGRRRALASVGAVACLPAATLAAAGSASAASAGTTNLATTKSVMVAFTVSPGNKLWTSGWGWTTVAPTTYKHLGSGRVTFSDGGASGSLTANLVPNAGTHGHILVKAIWHNCPAL